MRLLFDELEDRNTPSLAAPVDYPVAANPLTSVAAGDFTDNHIQDLVVCGSGPTGGTVSVLLGKGDGTFGPGGSFPTGMNPQSLAVGDLTGSGKLDVVTANLGDSSGPGSVSVLLGNGDGTFQAPLNFALPGEFPPGYTGSAPLPQKPLSVAVGDMNHDGRLDVVVTAQTSFSMPAPTGGTTTVTNGYVDVLLGNGDGTFTLGSTTLLDIRQPRSVALADFNGDGHLDVAAVSPCDNGGCVLLGKDDGTLGAPSFFATDNGPTSLVVGDVNGDGSIDLVTANAGQEYIMNTNAYWAGSVSVLLGNGDGTFQPASTSPLPTVPVSGAVPFWPGSPPLAVPQVPRAVVMGDLNGDGKMDLAVAANYWYSGFVITTSSAPYDYWKSESEGTVNVLLGNGDGTFTDDQTIYLNEGNYSSPLAMTAGDFNGDSFPDLAVVDSTNTLSVLLNAADWSTTPQPSSFAVSGFPSSTTAGVSGNFTVTALNTDGTTDTGFTGTVHFTSSDGQAALPADYTFQASDAGVHTFSATLKTAGTQSLTAADGSVTGSEAGITVTTAAANHLDVSAPAGSTTGNAFSITVTARDPYNNVATGYAGTVSFTSSDAQAGLPGEYAFSSSDAGVHTFTNGVILKTAGSQTVTAADTTTASLTGSAAVAVSPAAASKLIVTGFPSATTAGVAGSFTVTLEDAYGNIASGYRGTVHFTSSDPQATLPANYTFTATDAGVHTFSATLKTAGTQSLTATDTTTGSLSGTEAAITVKPAAASKFILSAPASVSAGVAFSLTVTVEDAYGNVVTGYTGTVHFSSTDSKATLPAHYTFTATDQGVHTFTGLVLRKKGYQKITITDTHNSSLTSSVIVDVL
jgi:hypothetical protein